MKNLIIGKNSQLSYFLDGIPVSSREIPYDFIKKNKWNRIYLCFAEQRTFVETSTDFDKVNYNLTAKLVDDLYDYCEEFVFYSTTLLWSGYKQKYDIDLPFLYKETEYLSSKEKITNYLKNIDKVTIHYPCNFNSKYRKEGFLFSSLYDMILNKNKVNVKCLNFEKEVVHASYIAEKSKNTFSDSILAPGYSVNIRNIFSEICDRVGVCMNDFITETNCFDFAKPNDYCYNNLDKVYTKEKMIKSFVEELI
jgi:hypothetical protein